MCETYFSSLALNVVRIFSNNKGNIEYDLKNFTISATPHVLLLIPWLLNIKSRIHSPTIAVVATCLVRQNYCKIIMAKPRATRRCAPSVGAISEDSPVKLVNASLVPRVPSGFPRGCLLVRLSSTSRNVRARVHCAGPGLLTNNAAVCKYSSKQCSHDLTFWDSFGSVSFFVYRSGCTEAADRAT